MIVNAIYVWNDLHRRHQNVVSSAEYKQIERGTKQFFPKKVQLIVDTPPGHLFYSGKRKN